MLNQNTYTGRQIKNDVRDLDAIADGYKSKLSHEYWLADALQKDTIQNSWDAKLSKKDWCNTIKLLEDNKNSHYIFIEDVGTVGLTGEIFSKHEELTQILSNGGKKDHLAHFVSSNFSAKDSESGGRRGRGKSLFLISSQGMQFYFDSLRSTDGRHVAGRIFIGTDNGVQVEVVPDSEDYLKEQTGLNLTKLSTSGTRILIKDPKPELVAAMTNGAMLNFIEQTWWEIIKKYNAKIIISDGNINRQAKLLVWYSDDFLKNEGFEKIEYTNFNISSDSKEDFRVKRLVLAYSKNQEIPENIRGIAIQRGGMTIERRASEQLVKVEGMTKVYGWLEMDAVLEKGMYGLEDVEHLGFSWIKKPAKDLLDEIRIKTREFAKKVNLIETELSKQHKLYKKVEDSVAKKINDFLKRLGFTGIGVGKKKRTLTTRIKTQPLRISLSDFILPNESRRIDFGESMKVMTRAINDLDVEIDARYKTWMVNSEGKIIKNLENEIHLNPRSSYVQGWEEIKIVEKEFPVGDYSLRSKLVLLSETDIELPGIGRIEKGKEISVSSMFSVEKDLPSHGFIKFEAIENSDRSRYLTSRPDAHSIVIEYNTKHPFVSILLQDKQGEELRKFLLQVGIIIAFNQVMREDLSLEKPKVFSDIEDDLDLSDVLPKIMEEVSKFMWDSQ